MADTATLTFDTEIEDYIREIVRREIKAAITDQMNAVIKTVITTVAKAATAVLAKTTAPEPKVDNTVHANQLADAIKTKLQERQAQQAPIKPTPARLLSSSVPARPGPGWIPASALQFATAA